MTLTDTGSADSHWQYDAFGNALTNSGSFTPRYTFATKEYLSAAKLYLYAYRVYDPVAGRWTQRDPIGYEDSPNLYQFCGNSPIGQVDPDGRWPFGRMAALTGHMRLTEAERDYYLAMTEVTRNVQVTAVGTFYVGVAAPLAYSAGSASVLAAKHAATTYMLAGPGVVRVFYSGYPLAWEHAQKYCQTIGNAVTIDMTRTGRLLTAAGNFLPKVIIDPLWTQASAWYASGASGIAPIYISASSFTANGVFYTVEYPILKTIESVHMQFNIVP
jgi:RHS repeat-associated protein